MIFTFSLLLVSNDAAKAQKKCRFYNKFPATERIYKELPDSLKKSTWLRFPVFENSFKTYMLAFIYHVPEASITTHLVKGGDDKKLCVSYEVRHPSIKALNTDSIYYDAECRFSLKCENGDQIELTPSPAASYGPLRPGPWSTWLLHSYFEITKEQILSLSSSRLTSVRVEFKTSKGEKIFLKDHKTKKGQAKRFMNDCRCFLETL